MSEDYTACGKQFNIRYNPSLVVYCDKQISEEDGKHIDGLDLHHVELLIKEDSGTISQG